MFFLREWRTAFTEKGGVMLCVVGLVPCLFLLQRLTNVEAMNAPWLWFLPLPWWASTVIDAAACIFMTIGIAISERGSIAASIRDSGD